MFKTYDYDENNLWNDIYYKPKQDNISFWFRYSQGRVDKKSIEQALYQCGAEEIGKGNKKQTTHGITPTVPKNKKLPLWPTILKKH